MPSSVDFGIAGPAAVGRHRRKRGEVGDSQPSAQGLEDALSQAAEMRGCQVHARIVHGVDRDCPDASCSHISGEIPPADVEPMCGRYDNLIAREAYPRLFQAMRLPESNFPPRYNIAPTDQVPIVRVDPRELVMARWGLIPFWMKEKPKVAHINARSETVHTLPLFREAFAKRRCLIPATGFYEWQTRAFGKQPYRFVRTDLEPFSFAGLWEFSRLGGEDTVSAIMIVGEPNPLVAGVHDRRRVARPQISPGTLRSVNLFIGRLPSSSKAGARHSRASCGARGTVGRPTELVTRGRCKENSHDQ